MKPNIMSKSNVSMRILELSSADKVTGRRKVKFVIHEIFENNTEYNKNGISWSEQYTNQMIESAKGMPLCVEFMDYDRSEPYGHGMSGVKDNQPLFEWSTVVGVITNAYVDNVTIPPDDDSDENQTDDDLVEQNSANQGETIRALIGDGFIYEQRYPKFVQWLSAKMFDKKDVESSVEICAKAGNESIIYDGGWKEKGRVPQIYDYTGHAILGIEPADDTAILLELNNHSLKREEKPMSKPNELVTNVNSDAIVELNAKLRGDNETLVKQIEVKDATILETNTKAKEFEATITEQDKKLKVQDVELNELRTFKKEAEDKTLVVEMNDKLANYTDEEKLVVKEKIEACQKEPSKEKIGEIISEINSAITSKILEARKANPNPQNQPKPDDIDFDVFTHEDNSNDKNSKSKLHLDTTGLF